MANLSLRSPERAIQREEGAALAPGGGHLEAGANDAPQDLAALPSQPGTAEAEQPPKTGQPDGAAPRDGREQTMNRSCPGIFPSNGQSDSEAPGRGRGQRYSQWGRGRRRGWGQQAGRFEERNIYSLEHSDALRDGGHHRGGRGRGHRGRRGGDHYAHFRGGGAHRKRGRGFTRREAETEAGRDGGPSGGLKEGES